MNTDIGGNLDKLCDLMAKLRAPNGCGWDQKQTLTSLKRYLIEETYEVIDAIDEVERTPGPLTNREHLEELGDLLFQIVFQAEIQRESGAFDMGDVCHVLWEKLVRRHPHIFGNEPAVLSDDNPHWERVKEEERSEKGTMRESLLDGIPKSMPALLRAQLVTSKAREVGFDWPDYRGARAKLSEELNELDEAIEGSDHEKIEHELGDIMLACIDLARHLDLDPERTLQKAGRRFEMRFRNMEVAAKAKGKVMRELSIDELEQYWQNAKITLGELPPYEVLDLEHPAQHSVLRKKADPLQFPLSNEDKRDVRILESKFDQEKNCAGLAAPQIGISKQIIVFAAPDDPQLKKWRQDFTQAMPKTIWINPTYDAISSDKREDYEGCFSVNDRAGCVPRYKHIRYKAYSVDGKVIEGTAEGFLARVIQHEIDHLNATLFIDHVPEGKLMLISEYREKRGQAMKEDDT